MNINKNTFKGVIKTTTTPLLGIWNGIPNTSAAEIIASSGFDWILIDGEHAPFDLSNMLLQLQALARYDIPVFVRIPKTDVALIKQILDIGVQNLLVPMVESAAEAELIYKATQYPPKGIRGIGSGLARAAQWGKIGDYLFQAGPEITSLVQIESVPGVENIDAILEVDGLDGIFVGPSDLAASMGYLGQPHHPEVTRVATEVIQKARKAGKVAGVMALEKQYAHAFAAVGANMIAVAVDTMLFSKACSDLITDFRE